MSIGDWMDTPTGGKVVNYAFGFGAAVVILGALFKIQHWPGGTVILTAGMGTEAVLFAITAFSKPHKTYHWETVFPQLEEEHEDESVDGIVVDAAKASSSFGGGLPSGGGFSGGGSFSGGGISVSGIPSLSEEDVEKLSAGITKLSETASQIADLSSLKGAAEKLAENMTDASDSVASFASTQNSINQSSEALVDSYKNIASDLGVVSQSTQGFTTAMSNINKSLSSINTVYELQLKTIDDQTQTIQSVSESWDKVKGSMVGTLNEVEVFQTETSKLSQQVAELDKVYGNMLNALNA